MKPNLRRAAILLALVAILLTAALIRYRVLDLPLERDEGEYATAGQLMLHGIPPYQIAWNMKFPGAYAAYAVIMLVFGQTTRGIHTGMILVNSLNTIFLFLLARRLFRASGSLIAAGSFAFLSMGWGVLGFSGHATHFVILFALAATWLLFRSPDSGKLLFVSGFLYGMAVLMKQQGFLFPLFGGAWLLVDIFRSSEGRANKVRNVGIFSVGVVVPFVTTCLLLWKAGVFPKFWFWTFDYARQYTSQMPLLGGLHMLTTNLTALILAGSALWIMAFAGFLTLWYRRSSWPVAVPVTLFLLFSALAVCPGLFFREHYFVLLLPAVSLLIGALAEGPMPAVAVGLWLAALGASAWQQHEYLFQLKPDQLSRAVYGPNPFPEAVKIAERIRSMTLPGEKIAVIGSEPEIYFYADRPPATGYLYTYALMETQPYAEQMQGEMIGEIEGSMPPVVVAVNVRTSWLKKETSSDLIFEWWKHYKSNYNEEGLIDIVTNDETDYWWGRDAAQHEHKSPYYLTVFRRKPASELP